VGQLVSQRSIGAACGVHDPLLGLGTVPRRRRDAAQSDLSLPPHILRLLNRHAGRLFPSSRNGTRTYRPEELANKLFILTALTPWTRNPVAFWGVSIIRAINRTPQAKWQNVVQGFRAVGLVLPEVDPATGSLLTFDEEGRGITLTYGIVTREEVASVIGSRLAMVEAL
jgi:hypothetical protein